MFRVNELKFQEMCEKNLELSDNKKFSTVPLNCLIKKELYIHGNNLKKTDFLKLWFFNKTDLRMSTAGNHKQISELNPFYAKKRQYLPYY